MRVLFWGTPKFALPTLRALESAGHTLVGIVTRPDKPRGRGRKIAPSPVKQFAEAGGYSVFTPDKPRGDAFLEAAGGVEPDISVVAAYGHILPRALLDLPPRGSINVHPSLLPALRGAAPINWAIVRGYRETGVTIMRMVEAMDAGPILAQRRTPVGPRDTAALLSCRLAEMGARLLVDVLNRLEAGPIEELEQDHAVATFAPKVSRAATRIDWTRDAEVVGCLIRGMDSTPGAWTLLRGEPVKLFLPEVTKSGREVRGREPPGTVAQGGPSRRGEPKGPGSGDAPDPGRILAAEPKRGLLVATGNGVLRIEEVQPAGKRRMPSVAWVRGRGVRAGDRFQ